MNKDFFIPSSRTSGLELNRLGEIKNSDASQEAAGEKHDRASCERECGSAGYGARNIINAGTGCR